MDRLTVEIDGVIYNDLIYNEQTGYYEKNIVAPDVGGMYIISAIYTDAADEVFNLKEQLQVFKKIKEKELANEFVGYFFSQTTFDVLDVVELQEYETVIDEETNGISTFAVMQALKAGEGDILFVKEGDRWTYAGIMNNPERIENEVKITFATKYITNIFNRTLIVKNANIISETGIEDFIKYTIEAEFTKNIDDPILNISFIDVEVKTHTKIQKGVDNEDGLYNFHTFITNATQNYNITYNFEILNKRLKMTIERKEAEKEILDCNTEDISNYIEVFETTVTSKVVVLSKETGNTHTLYLLNDRTTTTNKNNLNRAVGKIETVHCETDGDLEQTALNEMKGNLYNHLIEFMINQLSKLYDVEKWVVGKPFVVKTQNNIILETYISAIIRRSREAYIDIKLGNIRIDFIEKINQERKSIL